LRIANWWDGNGFHAPIAVGKKVRAPRLNPEKKLLETTVCGPFRGGRK
jgi:hypothetical protein